MNANIDELITRIRQIEDEIEAELRSRRDELQANFEQGRIRFKREILEQQRRFKTGLIRYLAETHLLNILTAPVIYSCIFPLLMLDLFITVYQRICFPVYGITYVARGDFMIFDRSHLGYLNVIEKFHCAYCSYGNGLIAYTREVISRTEQYFCPIKHAQRILDAHIRYPRFTDFGDAEAYKQELGKLRAELNGHVRPPQQ